MNKHDIVSVTHHECQHFDQFTVSEFGSCAQLLEYCRQETETTVHSVLVHGLASCAAVQLDTMTVKKGCKFFEFTTDALDNIAEELQRPDERFDISPTE